MTIRNDHNEEIEMVKFSLDFRVYFCPVDLLIKVLYHIASLIVELETYLNVGKFIVLAYKHA